MEDRQDLVDAKTLDYLEDLVRIKLTEKEKKFFSTQIPEILNYMKILSEVNTDGVRPLYNSTSSKLIEAGDVPKKGLSNDEALHGVADKKDGLFKISKIL